MQNNVSAPEGTALPQGAELTSHYQAQQPGRNVQRASDATQIASMLQQQGLLGQLNLNDPAAQAHVYNMLQQMVQWNQPNGNGNLEQLLAQISRQPEMAASIAPLLSAGPLGQQQLHQGKVEGAVGPSDGTAGPFTQQLYAGAGSGLSPESELKDGMGGDMGDLDQDPKANSVKCAKEKNRQAQRRFRERQKGLIQALKERADSLQKQVDDQRRQIETLERDNQVLKVILQEKNKVAQ